MTSDEFFAAWCDGGRPGRDIDRALLTRLVEGAIKLGEWEHNGEFSYELFDSTMHDRHLLHGRFGWIDEAGTWLSCGHASHEKLLNLLGFWTGYDRRGEECPVQIERTWVRVTMSGIHFYYGEPNDAQIKTLLKLAEADEIMPGAMKSLERQISEGWNS